jgi:mutator protein MutT
VSAPSVIGIAVVEQDGSYLVGVRSEGRPLSGYDEFPGGKCQPGESPADCAVRECREETGLEVQVERLLLRRPFTYPHGTVDLHFWLCRPLRSVDPAGDQHAFRWVPAADLRRFKFPEANEPLLRLLTGEGNPGW